MDDPKRLLAIEDIKRLKAGYFYHLDHKNWEGWKREIFAPEAVMEVPEIEARVEGCDAIIDFVRTTLDGVKTIHHGHMPIIDIESDRIAKAIWAMEDVLFWPPGRMPGLEGRVHGYGHYHEIYANGPQGWRITSLRLSRLHLGNMP